VFLGCVFIHSIFFVCSSVYFYFFRECNSDASRNNLLTLIAFSVFPSLSLTLLIDLILFYSLSKILLFSAVVVASVHLLNFIVLCSPKLKFFFLNIFLLHFTFTRERFVLFFIFNKKFFCVSFDWISIKISFFLLLFRILFVHSSLSFYSHNFWINLSFYFLWKSHTFNLLLHKLIWSGRSQFFQ
jgi:hypothetical protein